MEKKEEGVGNGRRVWVVEAVIAVFFLCSVQLALLVFFSSGNAMGHIRMIRSGGLHCCSNAISSAQCLEVH